MGASLGSSGRPASAPACRDLNQAVHAAESRVGKLTVEGRVHHLPRRLEDEYELDCTRLGTGCSGEVTLAWSRSAGDRMAVKSFSLVGIGKEQEAELAAEVGIFLSLDHPHVTRLMQVYVSETEVSLVMECCDGGELFDRVKANRVFAEPDAAHATRQMLLAVNYLHSAGVIHRDVKMENFLYDQKDGDFLKLCDFGFSAFIQRKTKMNESLGTPAYVAPEVLSRNYCGGSCDCWSLGVITFVLLSGEMPFSGRTTEQLLNSIQCGRYSMSQSAWGAVSADGVDFVRRLLVVAPSQRMTAEKALAHPWIQQGRTSEIPLSVGAGVADSFVRFAHMSRFRQACMQMMAWSLSAEERRLLRQAFLQLQDSEHGVIHLSNLRQLLLEDLQLPTIEVEKVLETVRTVQTPDHNPSGDLRYSDFLAAMMPTFVEDHQKVLGETFQRFDTEGTGYVTPGGLEEVLGDDMTAREIEHVFRKVPSEQQGRVTREEFVEYLKCESAMIRDPSVILEKERARASGQPTRSSAARRTLGRQRLQKFFVRFGRKRGSP